MKLKGLAVCLGLIPCIFLMHGFTAYAQEGGSQTVLFAEDDQSDYVGISIDGSYDDWNDKPHTKIQYPWDDANYCFTADGKETYVAVVPPEGEQIGDG